jgi:hypothetical protein
MAFGENFMTAKEHNKLVGIFLMAHGGFQTLMMLFVVLIYGGIGTAIFATAKKQEEQFVGAIFVVAILVILFFSVAILLPQIIGGYKLFKEKPNARTWGIIGSILSCLSIPFGTAAGVYGLWFLFGDEGKQFYSLKEMNRDMFQPPQPPPSNWA